MYPWYILTKHLHISVRSKIFHGTANLHHCALHYVKKKSNTRILFSCRKLNFLCFVLFFRLVHFNYRDIYSDIVYYNIAAWLLYTD